MDPNRYVFISYSSKNQEKADSVRKLLIEEEISCWMAPYDIPAGSQYAHVINDALENCSCFLLLLTKASQESQYVERELERAIAYKKVVIPVQLESLELNSGFKFYIGSSQIIAVSEIIRESEEIKRVLKGIRNCTGVTKEEKERYQYEEFLNGKENILLLSGATFRSAKRIKQMVTDICKDDCVIAYAQEWTNDLIDAIRSKHPEYRDKYEYSDKYINAGVFVLDGLEYLIGKEATQEELAYILRKRIDAEKKTILITTVVIDEPEGYYLSNILYNIVLDDVIIRN
ncbi:MAG: TIR domain-containing protein [Lachnospiraceae bacterium]|nr:TIR domain-containing protein [Lachnospiraceae bacterium]